MPHTNGTAQAIQEMVRFFLPRCADQSTLGGEFPYPFDDDSPFWVLPIAVAFARALGVEDPYRVSSLLRPDGGGGRRLVHGAAGPVRPGSRRPGG